MILDERDVRSHVRLPLWVVPGGVEVAKPRPGRIAGLVVLLAD